MAGKPTSEYLRLLCKRDRNGLKDYPDNPTDPLRLLPPKASYQTVCSRCRRSMKDLIHLLAAEVLDDLAEAGEVTGISITELRAEVSTRFGRTVHKKDLAEAIHPAKAKTVRLSKAPSDVTRGIKLTALKEQY